MTSIKLIVTGAKARAEVNGVLTTGMVGIPVTISYDSTWDGLTKTLLCKSRAGTYAILNAENSATVAPEALIDNEKKSYFDKLLLGVEGRNSDGTLVIPTIWAECGRIMPGANSDADESANPKNPMWAQILAMIGDLDDLNTEDKDNLIAAINEILAKGGSDSSQNSNGLSDAVSALLITILRNGVYSTDQSANITALETALGCSGESGGGEDSGETEVILTNISATYSGGDVAVGTAVSDLTGIVVTAHYSDGSTETVTGYTLSGEIAEGENTVTATYQGKTATFTVTGIAESGGETEDNNGWVSGQAYELNKVDCLSLDTTTGETVEASSGTMVTDFLPCLGVSAFAYELYDGASILSYAIYDADKNFIAASGLWTIYGTDPKIEQSLINKNAAYIRFTQRSSAKYITSVTPIKYPTFDAGTEWVDSQRYETGAVPGTLNATTGLREVTDSSTWYVTDYCLIYGASKVTFHNYTRKTVVWYDGNKNYISGETVNNTYEFTPPEGAVYMVAASGDMNSMLIWVNA